MNPLIPLSDFEAAYLISGRLRFPQLLLIVCYVFLDSCLPSSIGDHRQLQDIVRRRKIEWQPSVGQEGISEMKQRGWLEADAASRAAWDSIRESMMQQHPLVSDVSSQDLREHLRYLLSSIEQISAQGLHAFWPQRPRPRAPTIPLGSRGCLALLCASLAVTSTPRGNSPFWEIGWSGGPQAIEEMLFQLHQSPLFPNEIPLHELESALHSLDILWSREDARVAEYLSRLPNSADDGMTVKVKIQQVQTWSYTLESTARRNTDQKRRRETTKDGIIQEISGPVKRRKGRHLPDGRVNPNTYGASDQK
ncbi:hypothetical protein N7448_011321 [Penicillium atrosanguineum]|nr:hypothetical protein N7448_011321 [Penicillium atrosanguineum]